MSDETAQSKQDSGETRSVRGDSYARDHLANERTFLAWLRTAVALMGFGVLIARMNWVIPSASARHDLANAVALGLFLSCIGLAMIPYALWHYFATRRAIDNNCCAAAPGVVEIATIECGELPYAE